MGLDYRKQCKCMSKIQHKSRGAAKIALKVLKRKYPDSPVSVYHCEYCGMWHVGRDRK